MARRPHVALIVETSNGYGRQIVGGISRFLRGHQGWSIFLEQRALTTTLPAWLEGWRGDGIISRSTNRQLLSMIAGSRMPLVDLTDRFGDLELPYVGSDNAAIAKLAAEHFLDRGHGNFAFCGFSRELWSHERGQGFERALAPRGHQLEWYESAWHGRDAHPWEAEQEALMRWLARLRKPVAIFCSNDVRGQHVLDACHRASLAVPEEVSVLGVDNEQLICELCDPPLSSVIPNPERVGFEAAEMLDDLMAGRQPSSTRRIIEPIGVATRQSTDVSAIADRDVAEAAHYIRQHAFDGINVSDVLKRVPLSRSLLERRFRKYLKRSPQMEIRHVQLKRVKQLLSETELPLERVASLAGFVHPEYMHVVFKRETGQTPGQFRRLTQPTK